MLPLLQLRYLRNIDIMEIFRLRHQTWHRVAFFVQQTGQWAFDHPSSRLPSAEKKAFDLLRFFERKSEFYEQLLYIIANLKTKFPHCPSQSNKRRCSAETKRQTNQFTCERVIKISKVNAVYIFHDEPFPLTPTAQSHKIIFILTHLTLGSLQKKRSPPMRSRKKPLRSRKRNAQTKMCIKFYTISFALS